MFYILVSNSLLYSSSTSQGFVFIFKVFLKYLIEIHMIIQQKIYRSQLCKCGHCGAKTKLEYMVKSTRSISIEYHSGLYLTICFYQYVLFYSLSVYVVISMLYIEDVNERIKPQPSLDNCKIQVEAARRLIEPKRAY